MTSTPLTPGARLGNYQILAPLGAGGMGEVHRAQDTRLERDVAIKSLPAEFAQDAERLARFEREAKLLALLSHPNIAGIHGLEEVDGARYLVLEFVEGETLADRLSRGPLPLDEAVEVTRQVAAGVEAAHESGVIHRDLKPGNVMLTPSGAVKVLDFGLAKSGMVEGSSSDLDLAASPTLTHAATAAGVILGTAAYMSPEQARGRAVDKRTDIWSFGCVLYECLTGRQAFEGETISDLIAGILQTEPEWAALPAETPDRVRRLLRRCLEKDHRRRLRDLGDARIELEDQARPGLSSSIDTISAVPVAREPSHHLRPAVLGLLLIVASVLGTIGVWRALHPVPARTPIRFEISSVEHLQIDSDGSSLAISPDGKMIVFQAGESANGPNFSGGRGLWIRSLETLEARAIEGTEDGYQPFWSPDSRQIGFFSFGKLKLAPAAGGSVEELCESGFARGGTWSRDNVILFAPASGPLLKVSASGGDPEHITSLDSASGEIAHRFPQFLPDGRHYLYTSLPPRDGKFDIYLGELGSSARQFVLSADNGVLYAKSGHLLYQRNGSLAVQESDISDLPLRDDPIIVRESMASTAYSGGPGFSISDDDKLVYATSKLQNTRLAWIDMDGREVTSVPIDPAPYTAMSLSPDERRVALERKGPGTRSEIWIGDMERGVMRRFSQEPISCTRPRWSPDGTRIAYLINNQGPHSIVVRDVSGTSEAEVFLQSDPTFKVLAGWSPDSHSLVYSRQDPESRYDLWVLPLDGSREPQVYLKTPFMEFGGPFSSDGRWLAYRGNESGTLEGYVQSFPTPGVRYQVTKGGGRVERWVRDGAQLVFSQQSSPTTLWIADVLPGDEFRLGPERGFAVLPRGQIATHLADDGGRVLALLPAGEPVPTSITVVLDWMEGLRKD